MARKARRENAIRFDVLMHLEGRVTMLRRSKPRVLQPTELVSHVDDHSTRAGAVNEAVARLRDSERSRLFRVDVQQCPLSSRCWYEASHA